MAIAHRLAATGRRHRAGNDALAEGLGYLSLALGTAELLAPQAICRALGLGGHETLVRAFGVREVATGVAILRSHDPEPWIWGRVLGDALDIAAVSAGLRQDNPKRGNVVATLGVLAGVAALDALCASGLSASKGGPATATADYRDRSGFPKPPNAMRGAARDFEVPRDMRIPDPLRGDLFARHGRAEDLPLKPVASPLRDTPHP